MSDLFSHNADADDLKGIYVLSSSRTSGNEVLFSRKKEQGYTTDLNEAELFTEPLPDRPGDFVLLTDILGIIRYSVDASTLFRLQTRLRNK